MVIPSTNEKINLCSLITHPLTNNNQTNKKKRKTLLVFLFPFLSYSPRKKKSLSVQTSLPLFLKQTTSPLYPTPSKNTQFSGTFNSPHPQSRGTFLSNLGASENVSMSHQEVTFEKHQHIWPFKILPHPFKNTSIPGDL